jgi:SAM-dependent methyltransferase
MTAATELPNPEPIVRLASGFMAAQHLFTASDLGVFEALADSPATIDALAARIGLTRRAARITADAMVALDLLERDGDHYRNGPAAAAFLAGVGPADLRPLLRFWGSISYPTWQDLTTALASGPPREVFELDDELQEIVSAGIEAILTGPANALGRAVDFAPRQRMLDVGGGTGSWTIATLRQHPHLTATVYELPVTAEIARKRIASDGLADRIDVAAGDALTDPLPAGHDVVLLANLVHYWSPTTNIALLRRIRDAVAADGMLLMADFWTDPTHTQPVQAALMAGEFAVHVRDGDVYSVEEMQTMLADSGWRFVDHRPLAGPQSLVVAETASP